MLLLPSDVRAWAAKGYLKHRSAWLNGEGVFALSVPLGTVTEQHFMKNPKEVRAWVEAWGSWDGAGTVEWITRNWPRMGAQRLPAKITFASPEAVAHAAGQRENWHLAQIRIEELSAMSPTEPSGFGRFYETVLGYSPPEWTKLKSCLVYFLANPAGNLYVRQLPIFGVHTKWVKDHETDITKLVSKLTGLNGDFHDVCGVRRHAHRVRVRILCPDLRKQMGGLGDIEVPLAELAAWTIRPAKVLVVENLESGIALQDYPGTLAFMGMGNGATALAEIPWLAEVPGVYWGDLDTWGLLIFSRVAKVLPLLMPVLMDSKTLLAHSELWTVEAKPTTEAAELRQAQADLFTGLVGNRWGLQIRLEQERLPWEMAWQHVKLALDLAVTANTPCEIAELCYTIRA